MTENTIRQQVKDRGGYAPLPGNFTDILNISGFIQTVTTTPSKRPRNLYDQVKIYTDSLSSPTVRRLYIYSIDLDDWLYVTLST